MLPRSANTVIIGGGVLGTSAAFHLTDAGQADVVLVDRGPIASGTTPQAAGQTGYLNVDRFGDHFATDASLRAQCEEVYAHHYHETY